LGRKNINTILEWKSVLLETKKKLYLQKKHSSTDTSLKVFSIRDKGATRGWDNSRSELDKPQIIIRP